VPVVSIFTRNEPGINPERWMPLSDNSRIVTVPAGSLGKFEGAGISFKQANECDAEYREIIKISDVMDAVVSLFN